MLNLLNSTMLNRFITKWGSLQSLLQNGTTVLQIKGKYQKAGPLLQSKAAKQFGYAKFFLNHALRLLNMIDISFKKIKTFCFILHFL